ncbi:MAG: hypothetical protein F6K17_31660 [Okeania sp. SIO3C4]|nr:hypothetical protein [Okeania sp. SIO3B3]NER06814.1 hypothetical protein [Okeania sp. SIO3C4]
MDNTFQALECDTDILMIGKDTFTVERLKELARKRIQEKLWKGYIDKDKNTSKSIASWFFQEKLEIIENEVRIIFGDIKLIFPIVGLTQNKGRK